MKSYLLGVGTVLFLTGLSVNADDESAAGKYSNSSVCFNESLYQIGTEVVKEYATEFQGTALSNNSEKNKITGLTRFNGHSGVIEQTLDDGSGIQNQTYIVVDNDEKSVKTLGQTIGKKAFTYHPNGLTLNYNLGLGEKKVFPTVTEYADDVLSNTSDYTFAFLGAENITVQAGTFEACVFEFSINNVDEKGHRTNVVLTQHVGVGNGILLKEAFVLTGDHGERLTGADTLVSATINGTTI